MTPVLGMSDEQFRELDGPPVTLDDAHFKDNYNTQLSGKEEAKYQQWAKENGRLEDTADYDMRGAWKANIGQTGNGHFPDTFKKPNHPTFSDQSVYHQTANPTGGAFVGGNWSQANGKDIYTPSREMAARPGYVGFMQNTYMPRVEPNGVFNMDRIK